MLGRAARIMARGSVATSLAYGTSTTASSGQDALVARRARLLGPRRRRHVVARGLSEWTLRGQRDAAPTRTARRWRLLGPTLRRQRRCLRLLLGQQLLAERDEALAVLAEPVLHPLQADLLDDEREAVHGLAHQFVQPLLWIVGGTRKLDGLAVWNPLVGLQSLQRLPLLQQRGIEPPPERD